MKQDKIWDYFQNQQKEIFYPAIKRQEYLADKISSLVGDKIIKILNIGVNIGVGAGDFENIAIKKGWEVYSLDPSKDTISSIKQKLNMGDRAMIGYAQNNPFENNFFDVVCASEVLEHLINEQLEKTMSEIKRVLKAGGYIIGTVPSREDYDNQITICPKCGEKFHRWGHHQKFDITVVESLVKQNFKVVNIKEVLLISSSNLNWKGRFCLCIKLLLKSIGIHGSNESVLFIGQKTQI